jgi:hypothetical protein
MNTIRQQCFLLRSLINDPVANQEVIYDIKQQIEADMKVVLAQGHVSHPTTDVLFEALCFGYFNDLYTESDFYVMRFFTNMFMPFYLADLMQLRGTSRVVPNMYLHRFMYVRSQALLRNKSTDVKVTLPLPRALPKPVSMKKTTLRTRLLCNKDDLIAANVLFRLARSKQ